MESRDQAIESIKMPKIRAFIVKNIYFTKFFHEEFMLSAEFFVILQSESVSVFLHNRLSNF